VSALWLLVSAAALTAAAITGVIAALSGVDANDGIESFAGYAGATFLLYLAALLAFQLAGRP
jgi:hypothetical protein